jgi:DAK2 domain fusion protein YloV
MSTGTELTRSVPDLDAVRAWVDGALASLEAARQRIDDLNVYPVPDGDTGTNLVLTVRAVRDALAGSTAAGRPAIARETTRAALMGARGNSGVIFSQIVRGAADVLGEGGELDGATIAKAFRGASDASYRAVRRPVEGTMLTVIREIAEEAEARSGETHRDRLLVALVGRAEDAVARTPEQLDVLREAGVVDAGGAGLLEILRGLTAVVTGEDLPQAPVELESVGVDAVHQELSPYRYCTVFVVEGEALDRDAVEAELDRLGDSLLVVGDEHALKVHVHTDDPGAALSLGTAAGTIDRVEIANMHEQTQRREERLLAVVGDPARSGVVAVVVGEGNRLLFESLGAARVIEGGQTMNPATSDLVAAVESIDADEVLLLPNNANVILSAEQAAGLASRPVEVVPSDSIQAGLAAMVAFTPGRSAAENAADMRKTLESVGTGEVTVASRDVELNGLSIREGEWLGLADGLPVAGGGDFDEVASTVVERLLAEPREILTLLTGPDAPELEQLLARVREQHPALELEVKTGGQPHYPLLLSAE